MYTEYPWAETFRAGIILLCRTPGSDDKVDYQSLKLLMVWQKAEICTAKDGSTKALPARLGFPKGRRDDNESNALQTALRELKEETCIDIYDTQLHARIVVQPIIIPRKGCNIDEVLVYFIIYIDHEPMVRICDRELSGYEWINASTGLRGLYPTTLPTAELLKLIESIHLWAPMDTVQP